MTAAADTTHDDRGSIPVSQQATGPGEEEPLTVPQRAETDDRPRAARTRPGGRNHVRR